MSEPKQSDRAFGFAFAGVLGAVSLLDWFLFGAVAMWAIGIGATLAVLAAIRPGALMPFNRLWGFLSRRIALATNSIMMALAFALVVVPIGLVMCLMRRDPMRRKIEREAKSYWAPVGRQSDRETLQDLF